MSAELETPQAARDGRRPLKVLMLVDHLRDTGGAERLLTGLATHMPPERCRVTVCTKRSASGRLTRALDGAGVRHFSLRRESRLDVLALRNLVSFLRAERIDVLHAHKQGSNSWGAVCGRIARTPVVVAHEHGSAEHQLSLRLDGRLVGRLVDAFVAGSTGDRDRLINSGHVPPEKVVLIPGAYIPRPGSGGGDLRAELGIPRDAPLIGTVAVLRPEKALTVLLDAFARLSRSLPDARLVICGRGPCRSRLRRHAEKLGLSDRVLLPGYRDDIAEVLDSVDVAAISSDREGASLFALECMAHRTPLVSTDVGGPHDMLEDGVSALLVAPRDPAALADALASVVRDPDRGDALAVAAHERLQGLTIERVAVRFADLYDRLMAQAVA
jgi:glycosyltransferase involved in cell wall biosynthesis